MQNSITVWIDGQFVPETEARISVFDQGFTRGDAVFDASRTFNGELFQIEEHVDRLLRSCKMLQLEPALSRAQFLEVSREVAQRNRPLTARYGDFWIMQHVTRGCDHEGFPKRPTVIVTAIPLPFKARAAYYREGLPMVVPHVRRTPPWAVTPRAKTHNYINFVLAGIETRAADPKAWPVLLDENGNLAEGSGSNIFLVRDGVLLTPEERYVLPGITRATVIRLARELGIPFQEKALDLYDARAAEEMFATSTSLCICGVSRLNGIRVGTEFPGPVTTRLMKAFNQLVGLDVAEQYLSHGA